MTEKTHLEKLHTKIQKINETPYLDTKAIDAVVNSFDKFVNTVDFDEMLVAADRISELDYAREYMEEQGITCAKDEGDAAERTMISVASGLANMHRTLQQNFMRIVLAFIEIQAARYEEGMYDLRNEDSGKLCKAMWDAIKDRDDVYLRFI